MKAAVKVLYVVGSQRGGTTIAGRLIGSLPGFAFMGEVRRLVQVGVREGRICGCGERYTDCPVWSSVIPDVFASVDPEQARRWQAEVAPERATARRALRLLTDREVQDSGHDYGQLAAALYQSIAGATGARVIVDTSKSPLDAALLTRMAGVDPYFLQVVRDPRGTVHSVLRRGGPQSRPAHLRTVTTAAAGWTARHLHGSFLRRRSPGRYLVARYEDLVAAPGEFLATLASHTGEPVPAVDLVRDGAFDAPVGHTPTGRGRFQATSVRLVVDDRWRTGLSRADRLVVSALCAPLAYRYGYLPARAATKHLSWPGPARPDSGR